MYKLDEQTQEQHDLSFMWAYRIVGIMFKKGIIKKTKHKNTTALHIRNSIEIATSNALDKIHYIGFHHVEMALRAYGVEVEKNCKLSYKSLKLSKKKKFDISEEVKELYKDLGHIWN